MFKIIKLPIRIIYVAIALTVFIRVFFKINAITSTPAYNTYRSFIDFIYNTSDKFILPINIIITKAQLIIPAITTKFFPVITFPQNNGKLEWAGIIALLVYVMIGIIIEHLFHILSEYESAFFKVTKTSREVAKQRKLQKIKEESNFQNQFGEKEQTLKNVYNLIIKRLDREKTELVNKNISLEKELITDTLTGLKTRKYFDERLKYEFNNAKVRKMHLSIIMIDIDHFKKVNDQYGHQVGDMVLKDVAQIIINSCKVKSFAARYGGEEIVVVCPKNQLNETQNLAETLRTNIENKLKYSSNICSAITISAGVATYNGKDSLKTPEELIEKADIALYEAKNNGRNQVKISQF